MKERKTTAGIPKPRAVRILALLLLLLALLIAAGIFLFKTRGPAPPAEVSIEQAEAIAKEWMRTRCPTYTFDGSSLELVSSEKVNGAVEVTLSFVSSAAGYGERSGRMLAQVITEHQTVITVEKGRVVSAITDGVYDEKNEEMIEEAARPVDVYFVQVEEGQERIEPVERQVSRDQAVGEALAALLKGPSPAEAQEDDYSTSIPEKTELLGLRIEEGVAYADFSSEIEVPGGSAWVMMIRDQVTRTLTQFDHIEKVVITVEGEEEEVLQP